VAERAFARAKPVIGLVYLLVLIGLVGLCVVAYQRAFPWQRMVPVTLTTAQAGLQLNPRSDVKLKGIVVGQVDSITSDGRQATLHLSLDPAMTHLVPADVDASIVPKTLFGEKQVNLIPPPGGSATPIAAGDVIRQSSTSVEIGELYTNLQGVLETLQPAQLSLALNSLADALAGRGAELGTTVSALNTYLAGLNPHLPTLVHDINALAATSDVYADAAPDLLRTLDNASTISADLLVPHEQSLADVLHKTIIASDEVTDFVHRTDDTVITLTGHSRPVLDLLARYSSELPCLFDTLVLGNKAENHVLGGQGPYLSASIDLLVQRPPYENPEQLPANRSSAGNNETLPAGIPNWAPHCSVVPTQLRGLHDVGPYELATQGPVAPALSGAPDESQRTLTDSLGGQLLGVPPAQVPGTAQLLLLPLVMGGKVTVP
jgi:phospholipid/cholesterol/gamma-HCH transport system substrate-binding protein